MNPARTEEMSLKDNYWYRIVQELLDKAGIEINGPQPWDIQVKNPNFFQRVIEEGSMGLGESYMDDWWECASLDMFFHRVLRAGLDQQVPKRYWDMLRVIIARIFNLQSRSRASMVIKTHYDIGNDLFSAMLDPNMQYSCGYWKNADTLEQAQKDKLSMICKKLQLRPGMTLLDIGCGWGGLADYVARHHGVKVTGITISVEQQRYAQQRCKGLDVTILLQDYRDPLEEKFDRIVSVEFVEHVGPKNLAEYFKTVDRSLKSDGLHLMQVNGTNRSAHLGDPWTDKYIFPNGWMPSIRQIAEAAEEHFVVEDWCNIGVHYDRTLMAWNSRFLEAWPRLQHKYDNRFKRMFSYYLISFAGAFRARTLQVWQVVFSRGLESDQLVSH